jgi:hypothetical protein
MSNKRVTKNEYNQRQKSLKHTEKYTRVVDELKKKAVNALPDYKF